MQNKELLQESKSLASLAVFRELYNSEKDIYGIISEFLKDVISSNHKYQFSLTELTQLLNDTYDFKIPEAVVSSSLNRFKDSLEKDLGLYTIKDQSFFHINGRVADSHANIQQNNQVIISNLFQFVENEKKKSLSEYEKEKIVHSFCSFIIDESTSQDYSEYISAFIVKEQQNVSFTNQLNLIKEGVVLYTGLKYNSNLNELGAWKTDLTIFIETEILFHFAGFNGLLFQTLFNDFFVLVKEINSKSAKSNGRKLIQLKYFSEVKDEIDRFFRKAEYIVIGKDKANPSKTAMTSIIDGCKTPAEVIEKKTAFYELLKSNSILEDTYNDYYSEYNHKYNIEDQSLITELVKKTGIEDVSSYLKFLNYIKIHRKSSNIKGFENVGYVLLSGTSNTLILAWDELIKPNGDVPLASNLSFLTNKLWFRLNKGFGKGDYPKTFDIVSKAQIVLSTQINDSVADKFADLQIKFKGGKITEEQAIASIAELRKQAKKPEDIDEHDIENALITIGEHSIERYLQEQELLKNKANQYEIENEKLKEELNQFREKDKIKNEKKHKRQRYWMYILFCSFFVILGILLYLFFSRITGILIAIISGIFTILAFFGIDYKYIKKNFL